MCKSNGEHNVVGLRSLTRAGPTLRVWFQPYGMLIMKDPAHVERVCPACNVVIGPEAPRCWLCGESFVKPAPSAADSLSPFAPVDLPGSGHRAPPQFSLASLMLDMTLISVALGLFGLEPGLGIGFAILVTPAAIRAAFVAKRRRRAQGQPLGLGEKARLLITSLLVVLFIVVAAWAAFLATCWVGFFGGMAVTHATGQKGELVGWGEGLITGVVCGVIAALVATFFMARWLWKGK